MDKIMVLIFLIPCLFIACDIFIYVRNIYKIFHIGRWENFHKWENAVYQTCCKWTLRVSNVKIKDEYKYFLWDYIIHKQRSAVIQYWQEAGLILGLHKYNSPHKDNVIHRNIDYTTGNWIINIQQVDIGLLAYSILYSCSDPQRIRIAMDEAYQYITTNLSNGTIPYRREIPDIRFVDTLGLVCPFLMLYGTIYHIDDAIKLAIRQIEEYDQAFHSTCNLPCHAYDIKYHRPRGIYDWGRGTGWYILAIIQCLDICRQNKIGYETTLTNKVINLGETLLPLQLANGGYAEMLFNRNGFSESSATILIGLLMSKCYEITKSVKYKEAVNKIIENLMSSTLRSGQIFYCQGDTRGIGYYSKDFSTMPFAQGLLLCLIKEVKRINANS